MGFAACILQWFGHGVGRNAEFDLIIALGIGIGVAFERIETSLLAMRIGVARSRDLLLVLLVLRLIVSDRQGSALVLLSPEFRASMYAAEQAVLDDVKDRRHPRRRLLQQQGGVPGRGKAVRGG